MLHLLGSLWDTAVVGRGFFCRHTYSMACVTCLLVTDEILSADAGVVLWDIR